MGGYSKDRQSPPEHLAELEAWHQRYDDARFAGKEPDEACRLADQKGPTKRKLRSVPDLSLAKKQQLAVLVAPRALVDPMSLVFSPGAVIPVNEGAKIEFLPMASSASTTQVVSIPTPRVVIPDGVHLH